MRVPHPNSLGWVGTKPDARTYQPVLNLSKGEPELNGVTCLRSRYGTNRKTGRPRVTAMDGRTIRTPGYAVSQG